MSFKIDKKAEKLFLNLRELRELCLLAYNKGIKDNSLLDILNDKDNVENIIKYIGKGDK